MKRLLLLVVLAALGFYVGWPAWSGYQLQQALERKDVATVERKIDFASVRLGLEPAITREIGAALDRYIAELGPLASVLGGQIKQQYAPQITKTAVDTLVTPANVVRIYAERNDLRGAVERVLIEELSKPGVLTGATAAAPAPAATAGGGLNLRGGFGGIGDLVTKQVETSGGGKMPAIQDVLKGAVAKDEAARKAKPEAAPPTKKSEGFGLGNIKQFGFNGPLAMQVGIAADAKATKPDVIAEMSFRGLDWKLTKVVPGM